MALTVIRPGMLTTIQDVGRWGHQHSGVPVAGPMDWYSHRLANQLAGNDEHAALLEITLMGPELETDADATCAVAGAEFDVDVNGARVASPGSFLVPRGATVRFGARRRGARAFLSIRGGVDVPAILGSRSTSVVARMGPLGGRPLRARDVLPIGEWTAGSRAAAGSAPGSPIPLLAGGARLRVVRGPHDAMFASGSWETLLRSRYIVTPDSNRMGYRLNGPALAHAGDVEILSDATPMGSLQVPASGQPIVLMADRQTTGGYPKIATVITADLPLAGQLAPGDWIEFEDCTRAAAIDALRAITSRLAGAAG